MHSPTNSPNCFYANTKVGSSPLGREKFFYDTDILQSASYFNGDFFVEKLNYCLTQNGILTSIQASVGDNRIHMDLKLFGTDKYGPC